MNVAFMQARNLLKTKIDGLPKTYIYWFPIEAQVNPRPYGRNTRCIRSLLTLVDCLIGLLVSWMIGWLDDWWIGWLVDWLIVWLVGALVGWFETSVLFQSSFFFRISNDILLSSYPPYRRHISPSPWSRERISSHRSYRYSRRGKRISM